MNKISAGLLAVCCILSISSAQYLESTIYLPDSLGGLSYPRSIAWNPMNNQVYVAGELGDCVIAIDAQTLQKVARIPSGRGGAALLCTQPANKVYCADESSGSVTIIDGSRNVLLARVAVSDSPQFLCYNTAQNKVYTTGYALSCSTVAVISGLSDSVIAMVRVGGWPSGLCYNPTGSKVYCSGWEIPDTNAVGRVSVIDGRTDTIASVLRVDNSVSGVICLNSVDNKLYVLDRYGLGRSVWVVDGSADTLLAMIPAEGGDVLGFSRSTDRVYFCCRPPYNDFWVVDCSRDSILDSFDLGEVRALCSNPQEQKFYASVPTSGEVVVIDETARRISARVQTGSPPGALCYDSTDNLLFTTERLGFSVAAIDGRTDSVRGHVFVGDYPSGIWTDSVAGSAFVTNLRSGRLTVVDGALRTRSVAVGDSLVAISGSSRTRKVYCADAARGRVVVLDLDSAGVIGEVPVGSGPSAISVAPGGGRVYVANYGVWPLQDSTVTVLDGNTDTVIATVTTGNRPQSLCYNAAMGKLYCANFGSNTVSVIDGLGDSVLAQISVGAWPGPLEYSSTSNKVYSASRFAGELSVIDCSADTVVATVSVGRQPWALCYSPAVNRIYCANRYSGTLSILDCRNDSVIATVAVGSRPEALSCDPARNLVYCACAGSDSVYVIDGQMNVVVGCIKVGREPNKLAFDSATGRTYVANYLGSSLSVIRDTSTGIAEGRKPKAAGRKRETSVVRGMLYIGLGHNPNSPEGIGLCPALLLDASGRRVMELQPGENDVRRLGPGVYFIRTEGSPEIRRVTIVR